VTGRLLVVTAVDAEADAVRAGLGGHGLVVAGGVGSAAAAASTAGALAAGRFAAVVSAGIGGGFGVPPGGTVVASTSVAADLGADSPDGFISLDELGFGSSTMAADPRLLDRLTAALPDAHVGTVLTVSTVTGTAERAGDLRRRHPDAVAEAMEGFGVATAARLAGVPFGEVRTISNPVGPRDRTTWRIGDALAGLSKAFATLAELTL
jgi:futalosine hydrolase